MKKIIKSIINSFRDFFNPDYPEAISYYEWVAQKEESRSNRVLSVRLSKYQPDDFNTVFESLKYELHQFFKNSLDK